MVTREHIGWGVFLFDFYHYLILDRFYLKNGSYLGGYFCTVHLRSVNIRLNSLLSKTKMLTYKAMYKFLDEGVHGEVLDFPGTISFAENLEQVRRSLANALVEMAETNLMNGESLPRPDPLISDPEADLEEPIHLILTAASRIQVIPDIAAS